MQPILGLPKPLGKVAYERIFTANHTDHSTLIRLSSLRLDVVLNPTDVTMAVAYQRALLDFYTNRLRRVNTPPKTAAAAEFAWQLPAGREAGMPRTTRAVHEATPIFELICASLLVALLSRTHAQSPTFWDALRTMASRVATLHGDLIRRDTTTTLADVWTSCDTLAQPHRRRRREPIVYCTHFYTGLEAASFGDAFFAKAQALRAWDTSAADTALEGLALVMRAVGKYRRAARFLPAVAVLQARLVHASALSWRALAEAAVAAARPDVALACVATAVAEAPGDAAIKAYHAALHGDNAVIYHASATPTTIQLEFIPTQAPSLDISSDDTTTVCRIGVDVAL